MRFWDTSVLVPFLVEEPLTAPCQALYREDASVIVGWPTLVECASAIARAERDGVLAPPATTAAFTRLDAIAGAWFEVEPVSDVRDVARRLLRVHALRAADAIQLASAILAAERRPHTLAFVTADDRLEAAALREGFPVVVPGRSGA